MKGCKDVSLRLAQWVLARLSGVYIQRAEAKPLLPGLVKCKTTIKQLFVQYRFGAMDHEQLWLELPST